MSHDQDLGSILKEFSALSDADRKAVLKRLSSSERRALEKASREEQVHPNVRVLAAYSPWLAKHLAPIVRSEARNPQQRRVSEATRRAVLDVLSASNSARR